MNIHPNAYYNYLKQTKANCYRQKIAILIIMSVEHRFMKVFLGRQGIHLSKTTVHKYMNKELSLASICRRKEPNYKKGNAHRLFPNLLKQNFVSSKPNRVWCTDFTYLYLANGTIRYNCTIIDLYDRSAVASENGKIL